MKDKALTISLRSCYNTPQMYKTTIIILITLSFLFTAEGNFLQTIYLQPTDEPAPSVKQIDDIRTIMFKTQNFYRAQMNKYGYGRKTFEIEKDTNGKIIIHVIAGKHDLKEYKDLNLIEADLPKNLQSFWLKKNKIQILFLAGAKVSDPNAGIAVQTCQNNICGFGAYIPTLDKESILTITAHEIGHTFRLPHNTEKSTIFKSYIMNETIKVNKADTDNLSKHLLTPNEAKILNTHPFFSTQPLSIPFPKLTITTWGSLKASD